MEQEITKEVPANTFTLHIGEMHEPILIVDTEGIVYKGERVNDAGAAHRAWLAATQQMRPKTSTCNTQNAVVALIESRGEVGVRKYKKTMDRNDLEPEEWVQHHQEELCDALQYAERTKQAFKLLRESYDAMRYLADVCGWESARLWLESYHAQFPPPKPKPYIHQAPANERPT